MIEKQKKPNINDIALAAGVSKTTVSRYLNGRTDLMSQKTEERIGKVIDLLGYRPSDAARNLKLRQTNLIGVIVADMTSPFSSACISSIGDFLTDKGYIPIFAHSDNKIESEKKTIDMLMAKNVAGLIVNTTSSDNPYLVSAECAGTPIVLCDRYVKNHSFDIVTVDNRKAIFNMVRHLKEQGYTRPVLFTEKWDNNSTRSIRREAFISACEQLYGYSPCQDIYIVDREKDKDCYKQIESLVKSLNPGDIPAIIGSNTITTTAAFKAVKSLGLSIPEEVGVCGPDDWDWKSDISWPLLLEPNITTFTVPAKEMGKRVADLLLSKMQEDREEPQEVLLAADINVRQSTLRKK